MTTKQKHEQLLINKLGFGRVRISELHLLESYVITQIGPNYSTKHRGYMTKTVYQIDCHAFVIGTMYYKETDATELLFIDYLGYDLYNKKE